jgi:hypothetical protein
LAGLEMMAEMYAQDFAPSVCLFMYAENIKKLLN